MGREGRGGRAGEGVGAGRRLQGGSCHSRAARGRRWAARAAGRPWCVARAETGAVDSSDGRCVDGGWDGLVQRVVRQL